MKKVVEKNQNKVISIEDMVECYKERALAEVVKEGFIEVDDIDTSAYYDRLNSHLSNYPLQPYVEEIFGDQKILDLGSVSADDDFIEKQVESFLIKKSEEFQIDFLMHLSPKSVLTNICQGETVYSPTAIELPKGMKIRKALKRKKLNSKKVDKILDEVQNQHISKRGKLKLSIDPRDLMTISWNDHGWKSCFNPSGAYRFAPFELMQAQVAVAYIETDRKLKLSKGEWNSKRWRALVFLGEDRAIVGKQYPRKDTRAMKQLEDLLRRYYPKVKPDKTFGSNDEFIEIECRDWSFYDDFYENGCFGHNVFFKKEANIDSPMRISLWLKDDLEEEVLGSYGVVENGRIGPCDYCGEEIGKEHCGEFVCKDCLPNLRECTHCGEHFYFCSGSAEILLNGSREKGLIEENLTCNRCSDLEAPCVLCGEKHNVYKFRSNCWICYGCAQERSGKLSILPNSRELISKSLDSLYKCLGRGLIRTISRLIDSPLNNYASVKLLSDLEITTVEGFEWDKKVYNEKNLSCFPVLKTLIEERVAHYKKYGEMKSVISEPK